MSKIKDVQVLLDRVQIQPDVDMPKADSGLVLPIGIKPKYKLVYGTVVAVGELVQDFKVGDRVIYMRDKSQDLEHVGAHGQEILRQEDIWAKTEKLHS